MANKNLFASYAGKLLGRANATNAAGAPAYKLDARHQLAQLAMTGTLSGTFYASGHKQLADAMALVPKLDAAVVAKAAI